jgi:hypothetical protein
MVVHDIPRATGHAGARRRARDWVDVYRPVGKLHPAVCTSCGATEWEGRWRWDEPTPDLAPVLCPACERMRDGVAAHVLALRGDLQPHWQELQGLIANVERAEVREHPLERVMNVEIGDHEVLVPTTGVHLARRLCAAIVRRWKRAVRLTFEEHVTSIEWERAPPS